MKQDYSPEEIEEAVRRCREAGYVDPFFEGDKGYPNWVDFTDEAISATRALVTETQKIIDDLV